MNSADLIVDPRRAPADVHDKARLLLLDTLGCIVAGLAHDDVRSCAARLAASFPGELRLPGAEVTLGPGGLAALGALASCWDEACEGLARAHGRPGIAAIPVALAIAAARGMTLGRLVEAIILGYEAGARLGEVWQIRPGMHVDGSWHAAGAAAAAAFLTDADPARAIDAVACQIPASLYLPIRSGSVVRNTYPAHAALLAVLAAAGDLPAPDAIDEARRVVLGLETPGVAAASDAWLLREAYLKPYAGVRHAHYGAAAAIELRARIGDPSTITAIELAVYGEALRYAHNRAPRSIIQAQFSLSFAVAAALLTGDLGPDAYRLIDDPLLRRIEARIRLVEDEAATRDGARRATLTIDGASNRLVARVERVAGDPLLPMTAAQARAKFMRYVAPRLGRARAESLAVVACEAPLDTTASRLLD